MTQPAPAPAGKYAERIAKGAALLDQKAPGWRETIDLARLDLADCKDCVLGQLLGDFWSHGELGVSRIDAADYGFSLGIDDSSSLRDEDRNFETLTAEWRQHIEATR